MVGTAHCQQGEKHGRPGIGRFDAGREALLLLSADHVLAQSVETHPA